VSFQDAYSISKGKPGTLDAIRYHLASEGDNLRLLAKYQSGRGEPIRVGYKIVVEKDHDVDSGREYGQSRISLSCEPCLSSEDRDAGKVRSFAGVFANDTRYDNGCRFENLGLKQMAERGSNNLRTTESRNDDCNAGHWFHLIVPL
jgi:hypothetical protein